MSYGKIILVLFFLTTCISALAQQITITGKVVDSETGSSMSYASIRIKEKPLGTVADGNGEFTLSLNTSPDTYTLVVSFIGYTTHEIKLTEFISSNIKIIKLAPAPNQLKEVIITDEAFDVHKFMKKVVKAYQSSARTTPHIAQVYYQEQTNVNGKPMMFAEGIGYAVYMGNEGNFAPLSNYKFFYEQVSVNQDLKPWMDYMTKLGNTDNQKFGGSVSLNNFRNFELSGPLSEHSKKFKFTLDSTYSDHGQEYLIISFKGEGQSGWMTINEDNLHIWFVACNASRNVWSTAHHDRLSGSFTCTFDYFEDQPYLSEAHSYYQKGDVAHYNKLKVVSQKFDKLELSRDEYWAINTLDRFLIQRAKEVELTFQPYDFSKADHEFRSTFKSSKGQAIDAESNPEYKPLLAKLRAFF